MKDQVIVITGASAGIGAALAELVSQRGARVVFAGPRSSPHSPPSSVVQTVRSWCRPTSRVAR